METIATRLGLVLIGVCVVAGLVVAASGRANRPASPALAAPFTVAQAATPVTDDGARIWYPAAHSPTLTLPGGQQKAIHSVLKIDNPMQFGGYVWNDRGVPDGPVWVRVDMARQLISLFRGGHEIGSAVILYGAEGKPTPAGAFVVLQKAKDYHSRTYDAPMPFMLRLTDDGVAIHASNVRKGWATHGCIGVPEAFAQRLFAEMQLGGAVFIVG